MAKEKDYFHIKETKSQELLCVLLAHFTGSTGAKRFQRPDTPYYLDVTYDKNGDISKIQLSNDFPLAELEVIERKIQDSLLTDHGTKVCQMVCFCHAKIAGYFRYKDLFQILPIPGDEITSPWRITDYPFILEVSYKASLDPFVDGIRKVEKVVIYTRLLNLLADQAISSGRWYAQTKWVYNTRDTSTFTELATLGYFDPTLKDAMESFSLVDSLNPIERVPYLEYYYLGYPPERSTGPLSLPDNLEESIDKAFALDKPKWNKFFLACSWYAEYHHILHESQSSAFIALVTALECLAQEKKKGNTCQSCGQPIYRVSQQFRDFLKKYFPPLEDFPKEERVLYQVRSGLTHGMNLLQADLEPWNLLFDAKKQEQNLLQRNLYYIVGIAIFNWLQCI